MAFAGNDLVNFIGVPLSGLAAYQDYAANGGGNPSGHLYGRAKRAFADPGMVPRRCRSDNGGRTGHVKESPRGNEDRNRAGKQPRRRGNVRFFRNRTPTVRLSLNVINFFDRITPPRVRRWFDKRFNTDEAIMDQGAAFDLIRGSVNLVLAGTLIALARLR